MKNFSYLAVAAITALCLSSCSADQKENKIGTRSSDSSGVDSTNVDSTAASTAGGMPRDIPNGTGTDSVKKDSGTTKGKWPSQSQNPI